MPHGDCCDREGEQATERGGDIGLEFSFRQSDSVPTHALREWHMHLRPRARAVMLGGTDHRILGTIARDIRTYFQGYDMTVEAAHGDE